MRPRSSIGAAKNSPSRQRREQRFGEVGREPAPPVPAHLEVALGLDRLSLPRPSFADGIVDEERWTNYHPLQIFDRLSLYFCMRDVEHGEAARVGDYEIEPVAPWSVTMQPYPFEQEPASFSLRRRLVPNGEWRNRSFAHEFFAIEPEQVEITINGNR